MRLPFFLPQRFLPNRSFRFKQRPHARGFTLVEILVVIVIPSGYSRRWSCHGCWRGPTRPE